MDITIRRALDTDAPAIHAILKSLGWFEHLDTEDADVATARIERHIRMCEQDDGHSSFVAEDAGLPVGYASVHWLPYLFLTGPEGYLSELFVDEGHRGRGIASRLLDVVVAEAKSRGCSRLMLATRRGRDVYKSGFYSKRGWIEREDVANLVYELRVDG